MVYLFSLQPYIEASKKVRERRVAQEVAADEEKILTCQKKTSENGLTGVNDVVQ